MDYKQAIVVRSDLEMTTGKFAVQVAHASLGAFINSLNKNPDVSNAWFDEGYRKIVLKVDSISDIIKLEARCIEHGVPYHVVYDFGLTELDPHTCTCIGIGPELSENIDKITKRLKLWKD